MNWMLLRAWLKHWQCYICEVHCRPILMQKIKYIRFSLIVWSRFSRLAKFCSLLVGQKNKLYPGDYLWFRFLIPSAIKGKVGSCIFWCNLFTTIHKIDSVLLSHILHQYPLSCLNVQFVAFVISLSCNPSHPFLMWVLLSWYWIRNIVA